MEYKLICAEGILYIPDGASLTIIDEDDLLVLEVSNDGGELHIQDFRDNDIRCKECNRVIGYGTGEVTCVWCSDAPEPIRAEAFDAAADGIGFFNQRDRSIHIRARG